MTTDTYISNNDEIFLKELLRDFYQKVINIENNFSTFENALIELINNNTNKKNNKAILKLMKNHKEHEFWFSSIVGFSYQYGIDCNVDKNRALKLYLLAVKNEYSFDQKFTYTHSQNLNFLEEYNSSEFDKLQNFNNIIGKYLLSLFYYKDIILDIISSHKLSGFVIKFLKSARKGDPVAQYKLGYCYQYGDGVAQDCNKAFEWYSKSANNGCVKGQYNLSYCYDNGIGINIDNKKAFKLYLKSANNGCVKSQNNLGECYYYGRGIKQDYKKAFKWYLESANNGCAEGQYNLGYCYYHGLGIKKDKEKALEWYSKSADNGCVKVQYKFKKNRNKASKWC